jgi:signal peptidase I
MAAPSVLIALLFKAYVAEAFVVPTAGMSPAIATRDRVVVHKWREPMRWDIAAFRSPNSPGSTFMQRVVGLPGETIEIVDGIVRVNGKPEPAPPGVGPYHPAPYFGEGIGGKGHPITLGSDEFYVLGDNSTISLDSRYWTRAAPGHQLGAVPRSAFIGNATWIYWPANHWKRLD